MDEVTLLRVAGLAALVAGPVLLLSGVALALFFGGRGERWGPVNDVLVALALLLLAPAVVALNGLADGVADPVFGLASAGALAGIAVAAGGQLLLVAGRLGLRASFVTGGLGVAAMLPWAIGLLVLALTTEVVGTAAGVLLAATLALAGLTAVATAVTRGRVLWLLGGLLGFAASTWLVALGLDLLGRSGRP
jgi:hypothetical protein